MDDLFGPMSVGSDLWDIGGEKPRRDDDLFGQSSMASATGGGGQATSSSGVDADHLESWVRSIAPDADPLHRSRLWVLPDG